MSSGARDFNPVVIAVDGPGRPRVFPFRPAFELARHGSTDALVALETAMFEAIGV